jgi:hypothetical protein
MLASLLVKAICTKLRVLQLMQYYVKTVYGLSEDHFGNLLLLAILGLIQESAVVGAIWALNSSLLFWILDTAFALAQFHSPHSFSPNSMVKLLLMIALFGTLQ